MAAGSSSRKPLPRLDKSGGTSRQIRREFFPTTCVQVVLESSLDSKHIVLHICTAAFPPILSRSRGRAVRHFRVYLSHLMSNGCNRLLHGSVGSNSTSSILAFRATCCGSEISLSHALRLERGQSSGWKCCATREATAPVPTFCPITHSTPFSRSPSHATTDVVYPSRSARPSLHSPRVSRLESCVKHRTLHTTTNNSLRNGDATCAPLPPASRAASPSLPRLPSKLKPGENTDLPHVPRPSDLHLPKSPLQKLTELKTAKEAERKAKLENEARQRKEKDLAEQKRRKEEEAKRLEVLRRERVKLEQEEEEARRQRARAEYIAQWPERFRKKLLDAQKRLEAIERLGWSDKRSVDRYLWLHLLVERAKRLEEHHNKIHGEGEWIEQSRDFGLAGHPGVLKIFLYDKDLKWLEPMSGDNGRGVQFEYYRYNFWWIRNELINTAKDISADLHHFRAYRKTRLLISGFPEAFHQLRFIMPLQTVAVKMAATAEEIRSHCTFMHDMAATFSTPLAKRWGDIRYAQQYHTVMMRELSVQVKSTAVLDFPQSAMTQSNVSSKTRPFHEFQHYVTSLLKRVSLYLDDAPDLANESAQKKKPDKVLQIRARIQELHRSIWACLDLYTLWSAVAWTAAARLSTPSNGRTLINRVHSHHKTLRTSHINYASISPNPSYLAPWKDSRDLYPLGEPIPISYVTKHEAVSFVLRKFVDCKVVAVEFVHRNNSNYSAYDSREFLILASEKEVAIFHTGIMTPISVITRGDIRDFMDNPSILKVGFGLESQLRTLTDQYMIEPQNVLELREGGTHQSGLIVANSLQGYKGNDVSSLAERLLGCPLPAVDFQQALSDLQRSDYSYEKRRIRRVGAMEPVTFFTRKS